MKIRPVGAELFHADGRTDGQTDITKVIVTFRNFSKASKNCKMKLFNLPQQLTFRIQQQRTITFLRSIR